MSLQVRRGDIFYVLRSGDQMGSEQWGGRPGVIVSCDENNIHSEVVEVAYCTTRPKANLPTHVGIMSAYRPSTVLCEQINAVSLERIGDYIGRCTADEMREIDIAIATSLGLKKYPGLIKNLKERVLQVPERKEDPADGAKPEDTGDIARIEAERDTYKKMYEDLLDKVLPTPNRDRAG